MLLVHCPVQATVPSPESWVLVLCTVGVGLARRYEGLNYLNQMQMPVPMTPSMLPQTAPSESERSSVAVVTVAVPMTTARPHPHSTHSPSTPTQQTRGILNCVDYYEGLDSIRGTK